MDQIRIGVVINPISGHRGSRAGESEYRRTFVEREIVARGAAADIRITWGPGHARELASACVDAGCDVVVAMGGDGTVNEVAESLIGGAVPLGIVPCGSGDGLARGLKLPRNWSEALQVAMSGVTSRMDVGYVNDRPFFNVAGFGFDAAVASAFAGRATRGPLGYVVNTIATLRTYQPASYELHCNDEYRAGQKFLIGFANAPEYGNHAVMCADADTTDGLLDVLMIDAGSVGAQIWRSRRLFWRHRAPAAGVERLRIATAELTANDLVCHLDGEPCAVRGPIRIRVDRQVLGVRVPTIPA